MKEKNKKVNKLPIMHHILLLVGIVVIRRSFHKYDCDCDSDTEGNFHDAFFYFDTRLIADSPPAAFCSLLSLAPSNNFHFPLDGLCKAFDKNT